MLSKWKSIFTSTGKTTLTDFENLLKNLHNHTSIFILIEGFSKKISDTCTLGVYNRNAVYKKGDNYYIKASEDNFCFALLGKGEYASFNVKSEYNLINFDTRERTKELNVAEGFIRIPFPNEKSFAQGELVKGIQRNFEISDKYTDLQDFKLEKIEVWALDGMQDFKDDLLQPSLANNPIEPVYTLLKTRFEECAALKYFRENCFLCKFYNL